jgi:hypothetical protein
MTRDEKQQAWAADVIRRRADEIELARGILTISGQRPMTTADLAQAMALKRGYGGLSPAEFMRRRKAIETGLYRFARTAEGKGWLVRDNVGRRLWCLGSQRTEGALEPRLPGTVTKVS